VSLPPGRAHEPHGSALPTRPQCPRVVGEGVPPPTGTSGSQRRAWLAAESVEVVPPACPPPAPLRVPRREVVSERGCGSSWHSGKPGLGFAAAPAAWSSRKLWIGVARIACSRSCCEGVSQHRRYCSLQKSLDLRITLAHPLHVHCSHPPNPCRVTASTLHRHRSAGDDRLRGPLPQQRHAIDRRMVRA
jgi:hypothetical protein